MSANNNGGPAFPSPEWSDAHGNVAPQEYGMTLRDYFAAKAMQGGLCDGSEVYKPNEFAKWCYEMADAMLNARESN